MHLPLYRTEGQPARRAPDGHAGLWFDKFCDRWQIDDAPRVEPEERK